MWAQCRFLHRGDQPSTGRRDSPGQDETAQILPSVKALAPDEPRARQQTSHFPAPQLGPAGKGISKIL